jgi:SAM-dependent methyltransferase
MLDAREANAIDEVDRGNVTKSNEAAWNLASRKYVEELDADVALLRDGGTALLPVEQRSLGDLSSCARAVHLQCSHGLDALSLLNMGVAEVVGVDLSESMLALATEKAKRVGLDARARWVHADVLDVPPEWSASADLVYTGKGALPWVADIDRWAATVARLLQPDGRLFVFEAHPLNWVWDTTAHRHTLRGDGASYFDHTPRPNTDFPAAAIQRFAPTGERAPDAWEHQWTLGQIVTAVAGAGLRMTWLEEYPELWWPCLERIEQREMSRLPHMFALVAEAVAL